MTRQQRLAQKGSAVRGQSAGERSSNMRGRSADPGGQRGRRRSTKRVPSSPDSKKPTSKRKSFALQKMEIADLYRPLKKPVTLRLDADVLAWFKKEGSRYQTRINSALRKVMEREMKEK